MRILVCGDRNWTDVSLIYITLAGVIVFHDSLDNSKETKNMIAPAEHAGIKVIHISH